MQAALLFGPYDPSDPLVSVAAKDAVWNLRQASIGDSQYRPLGFYSKALPSTADNYSPLKKQLLVCYLDLAETKCLIMGYQVTGCYFTYEVTKLDVYNSTLSLNRSGLHGIRTEWTLKAKVKLHEVAQMPMVSTPTTPPSIYWHTLKA